ncbi:ABC transporter ATP-binding protein [Blastococcus montanus]|uniref:ABC transporter ATP-binding protein n=1 Tax=Blastococcus montanus TaxID=3144973 RepID=UPI00320A988D
MTTALRRLYRLFGVGHRRRWALLLLLVGVNGLMEAVATALVFALVGLLAGGSVGLPVLGVITTDALGMFAGLVTVAFLVRAGLVILQNAVLYRVSYQAGAELEERLLAGYLSLPARDLRRRGHAELVRNVHDTVIVVVEECLIASVLTIGNGLRMFAIVAVMVAVAPVPSLFAALVFGPVLWLVSRLARRPVRRLGEQVEATLARSLHQATETLALSAEIRAAGRTRQFSARFGDTRRQLARAAGTEEVIGAVPRLTAETLLVLFVVGYVAVAFARGAEESVLPTLGLFTYAALRVLPSLIEAVSLVHSVNHAGPALETVMADLPLLARPTAEEPPVHPVDTIRLSRVTVEIPETGRTVLSDVDLELRRGDVVAVVGRNGSGKSTLLDVLAGALPPARGEIVVDGTPVRAGSGSWFAGVAQVSQHVHLLDADILTNVTLDPSGAEADDPRLAAVIDEVGLRPVVERLAGRTVGEDGRSLSGGERQRVALARALHRDADVLLVDEGSSALDRAARDALADLIHRGAADRITVLVTHDPELVVTCNRRILVEDGRLHTEELDART